MKLATWLGMIFNCSKPKEAWRALVQWYCFDLFCRAFRSYPLVGITISYHFGFALNRRLFLTLHCFLFSVGQTETLSRWPGWGNILRLGRKEHWLVPAENLTVEPHQILGSGEIGREATVGAPNKQQSTWQNSSPVLFSNGVHNKIRTGEFHVQAVPAERYRSRPNWSNSLIRLIHGCQEDLAWCVKESSVRASRNGGSWKVQVWWNGTMWIYVHFLNSVRPHSFSFKQLFFLIE